MIRNRTLSLHFYVKNPFCDVHVRGLLRETKENLFCEKSFCEKLFCEKLFCKELFCVKKLFCEKPFGEKLFYEKLFCEKMFYKSADRLEEHDVTATPPPPKAHPIFSTRIEN